jgi:hypothetical protein
VCGSSRKGLVCRDENGREQFLSNKKGRRSDEFSQINIVKGSDSLYLGKSLVEDSLTMFDSTCIQKWENLQDVEIFHNPPVYENFIKATSKNGNIFILDKDYEFIINDLDYVNFDKTPNPIGIRNGEKVLFSMYRDIWCDEIIPFKLESIDYYDCLKDNQFYIVDTKLNNKFFVDINDPFFNDFYNDVENEIDLENQYNIKNYNISKGDAKNSDSLKFKTTKIETGKDFNNFSDEKIVRQMEYLIKNCKF